MEGGEDWYHRERLHRAAGEGDLDDIRRLLAEGCDINAFDDSLSRTPLHHAAIENRIEAVRLLLAEGADVNAHEEDKIGDTVLATVAANCTLDMAQVLVDAGADPTIHGWMQLTALDRSVERKKPEGVKVHALLVEAAQKRNPGWPRLTDFLSK